MRSQPHSGHFAIAHLAACLSKRTGRPIPVTVVTQNVDDLHERAGTSEVIHLHGSLMAPRCFACGTPFAFTIVPAEQPQARIQPPYCDQCGGAVRPGAVWFGEPLPEDELTKAVQAVKACDAMLVVGTSGAVYPAARLPASAIAGGAWCCEINPQDTDLRTPMSLVWRNRAAEALAALLDAINADG